MKNDECIVSITTRGGAARQFRKIARSMEAEKFTRNSSTHVLLSKYCLSFHHSPILVERLSLLTALATSTWSVARAYRDRGDRFGPGLDHAGPVSATTLRTC